MVNKYISLKDDVAFCFAFKLCGKNARESVRVMWDERRAMWFVVHFWIFLFPHKYHLKTFQPGEHAAQLSRLASFAVGVGWMDHEKFSEGRWVAERVVRFTEKIKSISISNFQIAFSAHLQLHRERNSHSTRRPLTTSSKTDERQQDEENSMSFVVLLWNARERECEGCWSWELLEASSPKVEWNAVCVQFSFHSDEDEDKHRRMWMWKMLSGLLRVEFCILWQSDVRCEQHLNSIKDQKDWAFLLLLCLYHRFRAAWWNSSVESFYRKKKYHQDAKYKKMVNVLLR